MWKNTYVVSNFIPVCCVVWTYLLYAPPSLQVLDQAIVDLHHWGSSCSFIIPGPGSKQTKGPAVQQQAPPSVDPTPPPIQPRLTSQSQQRSDATTCPTSQPATQRQPQQSTAAKRASKLVNATKTPLALELDPIDNSFRPVKTNETFL